MLLHLRLPDLFMYVCTYVRMDVCIYVQYVFVILFHHPPHNHDHDHQSTIIIVMIAGPVYGGDNGEVGGKNYPMAKKMHSLEFLREKAHLRPRSKVRLRPRMGTLAVVCMSLYEHTYIHSYIHTGVFFGDANASCDGLRHAPVLQ